LEGIMVNLKGGFMRWLWIIILAVSALALFGCGKDGKDGSAYLRIIWDDYRALYYSDNNPNVPETVHKGTYYECGPGTFSFEYTTWDFFSYEGRYTLTVNPGQKGVPLKDGEDGEDKFFTIGCYSWGPEFQSPMRTPTDSGAAKIDAGELLESSLPRESVCRGTKMLTPSSHDDFKSIIVRQGRFTMELTYRKILR
jgi:hypothetical protein